MSFSNVARTPSAVEQRSQSSGKFMKSPDSPHPGCSMSSSQSVMSILLKSPPADDLGSRPPKSTSSVGSKMSTRDTSALVSGGRLESPLYHSMLSEISPADNGFDAATDATAGKTAHVLEMPAEFGIKNIGQLDTTVVTWERCAGGTSAADAGRSITETIAKNAEH